MSYQELFTVKDKVVLITGGGRGIGAMITQAFVANGAKVYISSRKQGNIEKFAKQMNDQGPGTCQFITADLSKLEGVEHLSNELSKRESKLHILINNSGATWGDSFEGFPVKGYDRIFDLNVKSVFFLIQKCLPLLREAGTQEDPARVINIGSMAGISSMSPITTAYETSKAALHHMSKTLGGSLAPQNVNVNAIAYGIFATDMSKGLVDSVGDALLSGIPIGRQGKPHEAAGICIFLSSKASSYITGATISVDGGAATGARNML